MGQIRRHQGANLARTRRTVTMTDDEFGVCRDGQPKEASKMALGSSWNSEAPRGVKKVLLHDRRQARKKGYGRMRKK